MRPISLTLSAFGPFAGEVVIPFDEIGVNSLFLITGDTGAGKTTIFDGIAFALFGEASGSNRSVDSVRSDFAEGSAKTYAELTFAHKGKVYRVNRNPAYSRPKKSGNGMTTETAEASLFSEGETLATGMTAVTKKIEELLAVDARQFKQITMIAQGEFLELLNSDSADRSGIFRNVFHTDLFKDFQLKIKEAEKEKKQLLDDSANRLKGYIKQLFPDNEEDNTLLFKAEVLIEEKKSELEAIKEKINGITYERNNRERQEKKLTAELEKGRLENERIARLNSAGKELSSLSESKNEREAEKDRLKRERIAIDHILPKDKAFNAEKEEYSRYDEAVKATAEKIKVLTPVLLQWEKEKKEIENTKTPALEEEKIRKMQLEQSLPDYQKRDNLFKKMAKLSSDTTDVQGSIKNVNDALVDLNTEQDKDKKQLEERSKTEQNKLILEQESKSAVEKNERLKAIVLAKNDLKEKEAALLKERENYKELKKIWVEKRRKRETVEASYLQNQAGFLAQGLVDDEPCPVCGSTVHPNAAELPETASTEDDFNNAKEEEQAAYERMQASVTEGRALSEKCSAIRYSVISSCKKEGIEENEIQSALMQLEDKNKEINKQLNVIKKILEDMYFLEKKVEERKTDINNAEKNIETLNNRLQELKEAESGIRGELESLNSRLARNTSYDEARNSLDSLERYIKEAEKEHENVIKNYREKNDEISRLNTVLEEEKKQHKRSEKNLEEAEKAFKEELDKRSIALEEYNSFSLNREQLEEAEDKNREYFSEISRLEEYLRRENTDILPVDTEILLKRLNDIAVEKKEKEAVLQRLQSDRAVVENIISGAEDELKTRERAEREYLPVQELSKTANGELAGKEKIDFETFVQGYYFKQVLEAANLRFRDMTAGRFLLLHADTASNKRSRSGLEIEVMDHYTGRARSVKSLSGGEAFKASLSLALGLSDVIQGYAGGVEIDAMFIDEGFGTLDEQSREQAVSVLQRLSNGNRMVGIISHVTELKESIDKKIVVCRTNKGSRIEIQA